VLDDQLSWFVAGPVLGLCVVACRALFNGRLGVTGGFSDLVARLSAGSVRFDWRGWFAIGIFAGGTLYLVLRGERSFTGYSWLTETFHGAGQAAIGLLLLASGLLIGFGAKTAGGCTSGNGLTGNAMLSRASWVATATFFSTAIGVSFLIEALT
jgi:uncharacterized membrane protein YedE/YeeE